MRRIGLVLLLGLILAPLAVEPQPARVPRIGVLVGGSPGDVQSADALRQGLVVPRDAARRGRPASYQRR